MSLLLYIYFSYELWLASDIKKPFDAAMHANLTHNIIRYKVKYADIKLKIGSTNTNVSIRSDGSFVVSHFDNSVTVFVDSFGYITHFKPFSVSE